MDIKTKRHSPPPYSPRAEHIEYGAPPKQSFAMAPLQYSKERFRPVYKIPVTFIHRSPLPLYATSSEKPNTISHDTTKAAALSIHHDTLSVPACRSSGVGLSHGYDFDDLLEDIESMLVKLSPPPGTSCSKGRKQKKPTYLCDIRLRRKVLGRGGSLHTADEQLIRSAWLREGQGLRGLLKAPTAPIAGLEVFWWNKEPV